MVMLDVESEEFWSVVRDLLLAMLGLFDSCLLGVVVAWVVLGILVNLDSSVIRVRVDLLGWVCGRVMLGDVVSD